MAVAPPSVGHPEAASDAQIEALQALIKIRLEELSDSTTWYRKLHSKLALLLVVIAAGNTTVVTLSQAKDSSPVWGNWAIAASAAVAILSGANALFKPRQKQVRNAQALNEVYDVRARFRWRILHANPISSTEIDDYFSEFRSLEKAFFSELARLDVDGP